MPYSTTSTLFNRFLTVSFFTIILVSLYSLGDNIEPTLDSFQDGHVYIKTANSIIESNFDSEKLASIIKKGIFGVSLSFFNAILFKIFGFSYLLLNIVSAGLWLISGWLLFIFARLFLPRDESFLVTLIFLSSPVSFFMSHSNLAGVLYQPFSLGSLYFFAKSSIDDRKIKHALLGIICSVLAVLTRPVGYALVISIIAGFLLFKGSDFLHRINGRIKRIAIVVSAFLVAGLSMIASVILLYRHNEGIQFYIDYSRNRIVETGVFPVLPKVVSSLSFDLVHIDSVVSGALLLSASLFVPFYLRSRHNLLPYLYLVFYTALIITVPFFSIRYLWPVLPLVILNLYLVLSGFLKERLGNDMSESVPKILFCILLVVNIIYFINDAVAYKKQSFAKDVIRAFHWVGDENDDQVNVHFRSNQFAIAHKLDIIPGIKFVKSAIPKGRSSLVWKDEYVITPTSNVLGYRFGKSVEYRSYWDKYITSEIQRDERFFIVKQIGDVSIWKKKRLGIENTEGKELFPGNQFDFELSNIQTFGWDIHNTEVSIEKNRLTISGKPGKHAYVTHSLNILEQGKKYLLSFSASPKNSGDQITIEVGNGIKRNAYADFTTYRSHDRLEVVFEAITDQMTLLLYSNSQSRNHWALFSNWSLKKIKTD